MNTPHGNSITTAEHTIAMIMSLARQIPDANVSTKKGKWEKSKFVGTEITGKKLGLIGCGNIGSIVVDRAKGLKMSVQVYDPFLTDDKSKELGIEKVSFENLLGSSDIISLHIPLTEETKNLLNENKLRLIKKSSVIINAARGGVIDENQLAKLLKENKIAGAALDVFNNEPVNKEYAKKFEGIDNLILTPHVGAVSYTHLRAHET